MQCNAKTENKALATMTNTWSFGEQSRSTDNTWSFGEQSRWTDNTWSFGEQSRSTDAVQQSDAELICWIIHPNIGFDCPFG